VSSAEPVDPIEDTLDALDRALVHALETGDESGLTVLGYGEISCVLAAGELAAKPLPPFGDRGAADRYHQVFHAYLRGLQARGVQPVSSRLHMLERPGGGPVVWCVQPRLDPRDLLPNALRVGSVSGALGIFAHIVDRMAEGVGPSFGIDGQLSNWALVDGEARYLDVTTPMMRDGHGHERLDTDLFLASLPAVLRPAVRRHALRAILDKYYDPRGVVLDLLGNLLKERLEHLLPPFLEEANRRLGARLTEAEVRRYYAADARVWALMQRLRHVDRAWQRWVRRRTYPFLLPGPIER
jgi:hypothetical protein